MARALGLAPDLLGRWQRQALAEAVPSSAVHEENKRLRAELKRVEQERDILKKVKPSLRNRLRREPLLVYRAGCCY